MQRSLSTLLILGFLLSCSSGAAGPSNDRQPGPAPKKWQGLIHEAHRESVDDPLRYVEMVNAKLPREAPGREEIAKVRELVGGEALPVGRKELVGDWRCRSIQASEHGIFSYPYFKCRIAEDPEGLLFHKISGSQRRSGYLFEDGGRRFVFLGGQHVNDDPAQLYSATLGVDDGEDVESDTVGVLRKKGAGRFVMILDAGPSRYEIYELVK